MPLWLVLVLVILSPILIGLGVGIVLAFKLTRFKIPSAIAHLHVGAGQAVLVTIKRELTREELSAYIVHLKSLFDRAGVKVPVLLCDSSMDFAVVGDRLADPHQQVPA